MVLILHFRDGRRNQTAKWYTVLTVQCQKKVQLTSTWIHLSLMTVVFFVPVCRVVNAVHVYVSSLWSNNRLCCVEACPGSRSPLLYRTLWARNSWRQVRVDELWAMFGCRVKVKKSSFPTRENAQAQLHLAVPLSRLDQRHVLTLRFHERGHLQNILWFEVIDTRQEMNTITDLCSNC